MTTPLEVANGAYTAVGYRSAAIADRDGRNPSGAAGYAHEVVGREKLLWQSRQFLRENELYKGMLNRLRSYVVGKGFKLQCLTDDEAWNSTTEKAFAEWWRSPEITGRFSGRRCERLATDEVLACGESFVAKVETKLGDRIQFFEPEQIKDRKGDGILRDANGAATSFSVCSYGASGTVDLNTATTVSAENMLWICDPERPSSARAVPPGQASFPMLHRINDTCNSEAISWQLQARLALVVNRASGLPTPGGVYQEDEDEADDGSPRWTTELRYATIFHGQPGDEVKGVERTAPSGSFSETLRTFLRLLGLALGIPLEFILLDWTQSNYSQSRAVVEQFIASSVEDWQQLLEESFHRPIFEWWLQRAIFRGEIVDRPDKLHHLWVKPKPPWLDKLKESQASGQQVEFGQLSHDDVCKSLNTSREIVANKIEAEVMDSIARADRIEKLTGVLPPWEMFCGRRPEKFERAWFSPLDPRVAQQQAEQVPSPDPANLPDEEADVEE